MVFVNRHLKVPKWFKEWFDKLDPPKEMYSKIPYKKIPYAIGKVLYTSKLGGNLWLRKYKKKVGDDFKCK